MGHVFMLFYFPFPSFTTLNKVCVNKMVNSPFFSVLILSCIIPVNVQQPCLLFLAFFFSHVNQVGSEKDNGPSLRRLSKTRRSPWFAV